MKKLLLSLIMMTMSSAGFCEEQLEQAAPETTLDATIQYLMQYIGNSGLIFVRNDNKHEAQAALAHVQRKYDYFRDKISSPEQFIELTASRSLVSGKPYEVILPDGSRQTMEEWLLKALAEYRARLQTIEQDAAE